jgi:tetratricopeptide (TPR) repeat protein
MKREERHQAKRNDLATLLDEVTQFAGQNIRMVALLGAAALVLVLAVVGVKSWLISRDATGARLLAEMIDTYNAPILASIEDLQAAQAGAPTFTSAAERSRKVIDLSAPVLQRGGGAARAGALLYRGMAQSDLGLYDEAEGSLGEVVSRDTKGLYGSMARLRLARLKESRQKSDEAMALYQAILDDDQGLLPREEGLLGVARCQEALGRKDEAQALYRRLVSEYPDSEYLMEARRHLSDQS